MATLDDFALMGVLSDDLLRLRTLSGPQLWSRATLRKPKRCAGCHDALPKKTRCFLPITNALNRGDRLCLDCIAALVIACGMAYKAPR